MHDCHTVRGKLPRTTGQRPVLPRARKTRALPRPNQTERFCITSFLQLGESDLYAQLLPSLAIHPKCRALIEVAGRIAQLSFFFLRRSFFGCSRDRRSRPPRSPIATTGRMRWTGQIFWLLASDACAASHLLPAFTSETFRRLAQWEVVSSYSSATAPEFHGISCADPLFQARKELGPRTSGLRFEGQDYLISCRLLLSCRALVETSLAIEIRDSSTPLGMTKTPTL
jgi:hypothetical protein